LKVSSKYNDTQPSPIETDEFEEFWKPRKSGVARHAHFILAGLMFVFFLALLSFFVFQNKNWDTQKILILHMFGVPILLVTYLLLRKSETGWGVMQVACSFWLMVIMVAIDFSDLESHFKQSVAAPIKAMYFVVTGFCAVCCIVLGYLKPFRKHFSLTKYTFVLAIVLQSIGLAFALWQSFSNSNPFGRV